MLQAQNVRTIADVRSTPVSRFCPWFSAKTLKPLLEQNGIAYLPYGAALGGRPQSPDALLRRCRRLRGDGAATRLSGRARSPDRRCGAASRAWHWKWPALPDVRGARAARLPPLSVGRPCTRGTRFHRRSHPARRQRRAACGHRTPLAGARRRRWRPLCNWTERANSGSVSPPRPRRCVPGEGKPSGAKSVEESCDADANATILACGFVACRRP